MNSEQPPKSESGDLRAAAGYVRRMRNEEEVSKKHKSLYEQWSVYDSDLPSFARTFQYVLPKQYWERRQVGDAFVEYVQSVLEPGSNTTLRAVEFGGPGRTLFGQFPPDFFAHTIGVSLPDTQTEKSLRKDKRYVPGKENHQIIRGNIFDRSIYQQVSDALDQHQADLIISRMEGGLKFLYPWNPIAWGQLAQRWYQLLNENGLMFIQWRMEPQGERERMDIMGEPDPVGDLFDQWGASIKSAYPNSLELQQSYGTFRLHKMPGAPVELPLLENFKYDEGS